jgi:FkbM family methyltransferase
MENLAFISDHLESLVISDATNAKEKLSTGKRGRGLFLDCGSNLGQGFTFFRQYYTLDLFDYILIEPNPNCIHHLETLRSTLRGNIEIINMAASTIDGETCFFGLVEGNVDITSQGGSIIKDHNNRYYQADEAGAIKVRTFSLAELIQKHYSDYDSIILKLDIESGEYEVLVDLIANNAHMSLDYSYVEFHSIYMNEPKSSHFKELEDKIIKRFESDNVPLRVWV